jgi:hypothetical protein
VTPFSLIETTFSALKTVAVNSFETTVTINKTTWHHIQENYIFPTLLCLEDDDDYNDAGSLKLLSTLRRQ